MHAINASFFSTLCTPYYDNQYTISYISGAVATNTAIQHPNIFYLSASWSSINKSDFWNFGNTDLTVNNNTVKKTVYSPSPTGFSEPKTAAFIGFTTTRNNSWTASEFNVRGGFNKGWNFYCQPKFQGNTVFFSALGYRVYNAGVVTYICSIGLYWLAGPSGTSTYARYLDFSSGDVCPQLENNRSCGLTVRPASE